MKWAAGGLAYAAAFLYALTAVAGAVVALFFHLFVLCVMALGGWLLFKILWPEKTSPEEASRDSSPDG